MINESVPGHSFSPALGGRGRRVYKASSRTAEAVVQLGLFLETLSQKSKNRDTERNIIKL